MTNAQTTPDQTTPDITNELARGKFTDQMLADMRALIGTDLRTDSCLNNEYATRLAILRFCEGIGDDNPLWTDAEYAADGPHGTLVAPPSFIFACLGSVQVGWPGLGGFHAETKMSFNRSIRVGDKITAKVVFDGFDGPIADSNFGGRRIKDYLRQEYRNQDDELVATFICSRMRFERGEMQKRAETRSIELPHPWTDAELADIEEQILADIAHKLAINNQLAETLYVGFAVILLVLSRNWSSRVGALAVAGVVCLVPVVVDLWAGHADGGLTRAWASANFVLLPASAASRRRARPMSASSRSETRSTR